MANELIRSYVVPIFADGCQTLRKITNFKSFLNCIVIRGKHAFKLVKVSYRFRLLRYVELYHM